MQKSRISSLRRWRAVFFLLVLPLLGKLAAQTGLTPYEVDFDKDQIVNNTDFAGFAQNKTDLNKDGAFNHADLGALASVWLDTWTPIRTIEDVNNIRNNLSGCYGLVNDVNASETSTWNGGQGFEPIGNDLNPFRSSFFGDSHSIKGLYINRPFKQDVGLFGRIDSGTILSDIRLENTYVEGDTNVGALVGTIKNAIISKISSSGTVKPYARNGGGIVETIYKGSITDCFSECDVIGRSTIGGLIGGASSLDPNNIHIANCYSTGNISGTIYKIGGLAGEVSYLIITDCFSTSKVDGPSYVGGLVGKNTSSQITNSYFTDPNHNNGQGTLETGGEEAFHGNSHAVYSSWDFDNVWLPDANNLPTLRQPEEPLEELTEGYKVLDANDGSDSQSNHAPTQMILYQDTGPAQTRGDWPQMLGGPDVLTDETFSAQSGISART